MAIAEAGLGHTGGSTLKVCFCTILLVSSLNSLNWHLSVAVRPCSLSTIAWGFASGGLDDSTTSFVTAKTHLCLGSTADEHTNLTVDLIGGWCTIVDRSRYCLQRRLCLVPLLVDLACQLE